MKYKLTTGLIISSFVLCLSCCLFLLGYILCQNNDELGLVITITTFITGLISTICLVKWKSRLNILIDYGDPVFAAAEQIKTIVGKVNVYGVEQLQGIIEEAMKKELKKVVKK